jgi:ankyrin repeat protein
MICSSARLQGLDKMRAAPREGETRSSQLLRAVEAGDERRALELVAAGAPLDARDARGRTALHEASISGHVRIAALLLDGKFAGKGADVNAACRRSSTPLNAACKYERAAVARLLLAHGASQRPQIAGSKYTALHWTAWSGRADIAELLCAAPGTAAVLATRSAKGSTPLALARKMARGAVEAVLLAHGARA